MLSNLEVEALRNQVREAHEHASEDKPARDMRLADAYAQREFIETMRADMTPADPAGELAELVADSWDAIEFLRSQMLNNARAADGNDQSDMMREEYEGVSTGSKPKSKPPMNVSALDAADAEMSVLVAWAEHSGIPYVGQVWRVQGYPRGVLYGDLRPARSLSWNISQLLLDGWVAPDGMLDDIRAVRFANLKAWPELDVYLTKPLDEPVVVEEPALF